MEKEIYIETTNMSMNEVIEILTYFAERGWDTVDKRLKPKRSDEYIDGLMYIYLKLRE